MKASLFHSNQMSIFSQIFALPVAELSNHSLGLEERLGLTVKIIELN
jgi:hypothetical protein